MPILLVSEYPCNGLSTFKGNSDVMSLSVNIWPNNGRHRLWSSMLQMFGIPNHLKSSRMAIKFSNCDSTQNYKILVIYCMNCYLSINLWCNIPNKCIKNEHKKTIEKNSFFFAFFRHVLCKGTIKNGQSGQFLSPIHVYLYKRTKTCLSHLV